MSAKRHFSPVPIERVSIEDAFWAPRQQLNRTTTLPAIYHQLQKSGRIDALKLEWKPGMPNPPHIFYDSDVEKWLEAACYTLKLQPNADLQATVNDTVALLKNAQQPDGYLNSHYTTVEPDKRWTNLRDQHELYCAGTLFEAAAAHFNATGSRTLLDVACRYADYIDAVFGTEPGKKRGYCGHEEIELALIKLYHATANPRYLKLSKYFIDERGAQPHYYDIEARARGEDPASYWAKTYEYCQSHIPVRQQTEAVGHAVRATYLYSAMADLAHETDDASLLQACQKIFENLSQRQMYVTGGLGPSTRNEGFTYNYDLPNETAYCETCAAIGLIFWLHRMSQFGCDGRFADVMERALYNALLSGWSLEGTHFFYVNPLAVDRQSEKFNKMQHFFNGHRPEWWDCACCPPNVARLVAALGEYIYSESETDAAIHLYIGSSASLRVAGQVVRLKQETDYPWEGSIRITLEPEKPAVFGIRLRLPGWCSEYNLTVNGEPCSASNEKGYLHLRRTWQPGDKIQLNLAMPVRRVYANPHVRMDQNKVALSRGPIIYCLEGVDNANHLNSLRLPRQAKLETIFEPDLLGGVVTITADGLREADSGWEPDLYRFEPSAEMPVKLKAVPYYAWDNRTEGDMLVWIQEKE